MTMTAEHREQVATGLKRFAADIDLTEEQKEKLHSALAQGREGTSQRHRRQRTARASFKPAGSSRAC
jgi:Spy/CpxP family protein refolding chaperone